MPQAVWVGDLSFGLVNIPVRLYTATSPKRVRFHHYEAGSGRRIRYRREAEGPIADNVRSPDDRIESDREQPPAEPQSSERHELSGGSAQAGLEDSGDSSQTAPEDSGWGAQAEPEKSSWGSSEEPSSPGEENEVPWEEIVKGYEVEPGRVVTVDPGELESIAPERSHVLEVEEFVDLQDIDPVHFEKTYYLVPQRGAVTERPYWLLYRAMEEAGKVAIGRFVMRTKEYLVAIRSAEHALMLETLFYADEVRDPKEVWVPSIEEPSERELDVARQLLEMLAGDWEPARHRDEHRERLLDLIHSKLDQAVEMPETADEALISPVADLLEALQASVEAAQRAREESDRSDRRGLGS
jgi:DNA end-binding protein Ku